MTYRDSSRVRRKKSGELWFIVYGSVFQLFAAAEPYISVKITHGTSQHAMIRESNGVGKVEFSGCVRTDVPSGDEKQKTCRNLRKKNLKR